MAQYASNSILSNVTYSFCLDFSQILQESMVKYKRITLRALPLVKELLFIEDQQILGESLSYTRLRHSGQDQTNK